MQDKELFDKLVQNGFERVFFRNGLGISIRRDYFDCEYEVIVIKGRLTNWYTFNPKPKEWSWAVFKHLKRSEVVKLKAEIRKLKEVSDGVYQ